MEEGERMHGGGGGQRAKDRGCVTGRGSGGGRNYDESLLASEREDGERCVFRTDAPNHEKITKPWFLLFFWKNFSFIILDRGVVSRVFFYRALVFLSLDDE